MSKDFQLRNAEAEVPHQPDVRIYKDYEYDEFQKRNANMQEDNLMPLLNIDQFEIKGSDQNKDMFKDLKGEVVKNVQPTHTSDVKFYETDRDIQLTKECGEKIPDDQFM
jgi:hypothetical protein